MVRAVNNFIDENSPQYRWLVAIHRESQIRERINWQSANGPYPSATEQNAFGWKPKPGVPPTRQQLQEWWAALEIVWREYSRQVAIGQSPDPPPSGIAAIMADFCGFLAVGRLPEPMGDAISEGRTAPVPKELRDIGFAVAYHRGTKTGIEHNGQRVVIVDDTPTKTISDSYGVTPNTVRGWVRKYPPAFLGINDINSDVLIHLMKTAGKRYSEAGRSQAAIVKRARAAKK